MFAPIYVKLTMLAMFVLPLVDKCSVNVPRSMT